MKKFSELAEQYREKGRFKPTLPHTVQSTGVGPRPEIDSAKVKLKEEEISEAYPGHIQKGKELDAATKKIQSNLDRRIRGHELDAATKKIQSNLDRRIRGHELDAATKKIQSNLDKRIKKVDNDVPFDPPYKKSSGTVTDKSGAKHGPMSTVRHLARQALKKQAAKVKSVKESLEESRKAEIVKEIAKKKNTEATPKGKDKFESDPVLSNEIMKS